MAEYPEDSAFLDDDNPSDDLPSVPTTTNARELCGLLPGEMVLEVMERKVIEGYLVHVLTISARVVAVVRDGGKALQRRVV